MESFKETRLDLRNRDGLLITDLYAALAPEALFGVHGYGFAVLHLIDIHRADLYAFLASFTLVRINLYFITHISNPPE